MSKATNYWRRQLSREIAKCGQYSTRGSRYPIEWTVRCSPDLDAATIRKSLVDLDHFQNDTDLTLQCPEFEDWFEVNYSETPFSMSRLYEQALERVVGDLHGDDDGLRMWSPKTAASVLMPYVGDGAESTFDCKLENHGRGGKHVCLVSFCGHTLEGRNQAELIDFIESMSEKGGNDYDHWSNKFVRQLLGMLREWSEIFTTKNAEECALYYATDTVMQDLEQHLEVT